MGDALDDLVRRQAAYEAQVATCAHAWGPPELGVPTLGQRCSGCGVYELPWLRTQFTTLTRELEEAKSALADIAKYEGRFGHYEAGLTLAKITKGAT